MDEKALQSYRQHIELVRNHPEQYPHISTDWHQTMGNDLLSHITTLTRERDEWHRQHGEAATREGLLSVKLTEVERERDDLKAALDMTPEQLHAEMFNGENLATITMMRHILKHLRTRAGSGPPTDRDHGEQCQQCGRRYLTIWKVSDDLWAKVSGNQHGGGLICLPCFDTAARTMGDELFWKAQHDAFPPDDLRRRCLALVEKWEMIPVDEDGESWTDYQECAAQLRRVMEGA